MLLNVKKTETIKYDIIYSKKESRPSKTLVNE